MDLFGDDVLTHQFSFATDSPWLGFNVATMRIHSRARVMQAEYRANRSVRHNAALGHLLEIAHAHLRSDQEISQRPLRRPTHVDLRQVRETVDLRTRIALPEPEVAHDSRPRLTMSSESIVVPSLP